MTPLETAGTADPRLADAPRREALSRRALRGTLLVLTGTVLVAATAWWWDLIGPVPAVQPLYPLVPLAALALLTGSVLSRQRAAASLAAAALALSGVALAPVLAAPLRAPSGSSASSSASDAPRELTVLAQNLEYGNADSDLLVDEVLRRDVDVLVLTEVDAAYLVRLADSPLGQRLPHDSGPVRPGGAPGTAVLSRYPMRVLDADLARRAGEHFQQPVVSLDVGGREVLLHAVHPLSPTSGARLPRWRSGLAELADWQRSQPADVPVIMAGDFNSGWPHPAFREVTDGMTDALAARGQAWRPTWPMGARIPPFAQIDHILVRGAGVRDAGTISLPDSDHAGVWARVFLP